MARYSQLQGTTENLRLEACSRVENFFVGFHTTVGTVTLSQLPHLSRGTIQEHSSVRNLRLAELPKLDWVSFWAADISPAVLATLIDLPSLKHLDVSGTKLDDDAAAIINQLVGLQELSASSRFTLRGLEQVSSLPRLRSLLLYRSRRSADWSKDDVNRLWSKFGPTIFNVD